MFLFFISNAFIAMSNHGGGSLAALKREERCSGRFLLARGFGRVGYMAVQEQGLLRKVIVAPMLAVQAP